MTPSVAFRGEIPFLRVLDEQGEIDAAQRALCPDPGTLVGMYAAMVRTRLLDRRAFLLQREGRMGTYAPVIGQEACQIGSAFALDPDDWVVPSYRECGALLCRGVPMANVLLYWSGDERAMLGFRDARCLPFTIPVGTQIPHAVGMAYASRYRGERAAVLCYFGDGATSTGDFHEGLTMAGTLRVPVVFFCQNNQWAISVPRARQCGAETLAQKAFGYGIDGIQVDGNDVVACYAATKSARARAHAGTPTLIEAVTYRIGDHTTADDASRYRDAAEVERWRQRDPVERLRRYLEANGLWDAEREAACLAEAEEEVDAAVRAAESLPAPEVADIVRYTFRRPAAQRPADAATWPGDVESAPNGRRLH
jgi:pyruvate dehydrogenase E1 component alpha subunit